MTKVGKGSQTPHLSPPDTTQTQRVRSEFTPEAAGARSHITNQVTQLTLWATKQISKMPSMIFFLKKRFNHYHQMQVIFKGPSILTKPLHAT